MRLLAALLLLLPLLAHAEMNFITLKHRNAEALVPLLQPVLDEGVGISGRGPTLIINSQPWQLEEIRTLVEQLDTPLQLLMISVSQGGDDSQAALHGDVSGSVERPQVRLYGTNKEHKNSVAQQLRVVEGEWATISAGESIPVTQQSINRSARGVSIQQSTQYKELQSGFEVMPRLNGEHVTLLVRPFLARRSATSSSSIEQQNISTTVSGRLGEWIAIGGVDEQQQQSAVGTVYATGRKHRTTHNVKLKVERLSH